MGSGFQVIKSFLQTGLEQLAKETDRTKSYFVKRAITSFLDEMEDKLIAVARLEQENPTFLTSDELWRDLGWDKPADKPLRKRKCCQSMPSSGRREPSTISRVGRKAGKLVREAVETKLVHDPRRAKQLQSDFKPPLWSYRIGVYRLIYTFRESELVI
jgi:predicted DNA-binding protein